MALFYFRIDMADFAVIVSCNTYMTNYPQVGCHMAAKPAI